MKKSFIYIMLLFFLSNSSLVYAIDKPIVYVEGKVVLDLDESDDENGLSGKDEFLRVIEVGKYFDENYEDNYLFEEDLTPELKKFYPEENEEALYQKQETLRSFMGIYRKGKYYYNLIKEKFIVPEEPPLIVDDEDYDTGYGKEYIEAPEGEVAVVQDFKKVISYSSNPKDVKARDAKHLRDIEKKENKTKIEQLFEMGSKLDWKKLFSFDAQYSPFTENKGIGEWAEKDEAFVRIISEQSAIDGKKNIKMGLNFYIKKNYFILASSLQKNKYINLDFSKSENFVGVSLFYPVLSKIETKEKQVLGYAGSFVLPFTYEVKNPDENLLVISDVKVTVCDLNLVCKDVLISPQMPLEKGEGMMSLVANYVMSSYANLPNHQDKNLKIVSVSVDEPTNENEGEVLRVVFHNQYPMSKFDVIVEDDEFIEFLPQRISIDGSKIVVRFEAKDIVTSLLNKSFTITANVDDEHYLRQTEIAQENSIFDALNSKLSFQLILLAILGGFILNFMPCVFPVLSMKIMAMMEFGVRTPKKIRRSFFITTLGIWLTFAVLIGILCLLKYLGYSLGWGIQFQNPLFIVLMMFVLSLFMLYIMGVYRPSQPKWMEKIFVPKAEKGGFLEFATGMLVVVLATPCTGPYLATTIGFAFAGTYLDMLLILMAVSLGLSLPFIFLSLFPAFTLNLIPKPGKWMEDLSRVMLFLLFLTIGWLLSVYLSQTSIWAMTRMSIYLIVCLLGFYSRYVFMKTIEEDNSSPKEKKRLNRIFNKIFITILMVTFIAALYDAHHSFMKHSQTRSEAYVTQIDFEKIGKNVQDGKVVIVAIEADWCLTCKYNELMVFSNVGIKNMIHNDDVQVINVDWTNYSEEVLSFMEEYGRKGLPFYIVYSKKIPDGMVLPEILSERELSRIIMNVR